MYSIDKFKNIFLENKKLNKINNYYFEMHYCTIKKEKIKINIDFIIKKENSENIIRFGVCPYCKEIFYCEDYENKIF